MDLFYNLFWGWDALDFLLLALAFYGAFRLGQRQARQHKPTPRLGAVVCGSNEYNTPAILRRRQQQD